MVEGRQAYIYAKCGIAAYYPNVKTLEGSMSTP